MEIIYDIKLDTGAKYCALAGDNLNLKQGDWCVIRKEHQLDYGQVVRVIRDGAGQMKGEKELPHIERKATVVDKSKANENAMRAKSASRTASRQIEELKLPMKLLDCHYSFDRKLATFQFTADGRVDFRELVKKLASLLHTRIELRQIGVRDETGLIGGIGPCGEVLCCNRFLREFKSINVRMAKGQDISLNPSNISGMCCRLKCCLDYELEGYRELDREMPRRGACCECPEGRGRIVDRNLLTGKVTVQLDNEPRHISCPKDEIRVFYPEKHRLNNKHQGEDDLYDGLDEEDSRLLKELDEGASSQNSV